MCLHAWLRQNLAHKLIHKTHTLSQLMEAQGPLLRPSLVWARQHNPTHREVKILGVGEEVVIEQHGALCVCVGRRFVL